MSLVQYPSQRFIIFLIRINWIKIIKTNKWHFVFSVFPGEKENTEAFVKHMKSQLDQYGKIAVVNLVDQAGKEKVIQDAFLKHIVQFNHNQVTYVAFDFHEYW